MPRSFATIWPWASMSGFSTYRKPAKAAAPGPHSRFVHANTARASALPTQTIIESRPQKSSRSASFQRKRNRLPNSQGRLTSHAWSSVRTVTCMNSKGSAATRRSSGGWSGFMR